ncbi:RICIN domain-containing protein [Streptomyces sp. B6B3]|uniref:RICIN domain-containing protein n=1 Tax=Streptomyces sp. B6B3 TaxID=3153570 RepID=UPI00325E0BF1
MLSVLAALLLAVAGLASGQAPALAEPPSPLAVPSAGGTYQLVAGHSGRCVDVTAGSQDNGAMLQQWGCTSASWQQFRWASAGSGRYRLEGVSSGRCVDVTGHSTSSGTQLQQWGCGDGTKANQQWTLTASGDGTYQIVSVSSGLCMSVQGSSTSNGAAIVQETCAATPRQQWLFQQVGGGGDWSNSPDGFASTGGGTTGGAAGSTVTVTNFGDLERYATSSTPYVIRVAAAITVTPYGEEIEVASNKTIIGVGTSGHIVNGGFFLGEDTSNVIIRNLTIRDTRMSDDDPGDDAYDYDGIQMDNADHVWIDHNRIQRMNDGLIDSREDTSYLTVSWNVLMEGNKSFGIGWTSNVTARMTIHHNWIHDTNSRNPSIDNVALAHLYNNYLQDVSGYGNYSRGSSKTVIENSYFENVHDPYYRDDGAQLVQRGSILVDCDGQQETGGSGFNPSDYYSYTLDPASEVPNLLRTYAGPQSDIGV